MRIIRRKLKVTITILLNKFCRAPSRTKVLFILSASGYIIIMISLLNIPAIDLSKTGNYEKNDKLPTSSNIHYALPERYKLMEGNNQLYFTPRHNATVGCYTAGSVHPEPGIEWACHCRQGFYGPSCSIPEVVMTSGCQALKNCDMVKARIKPRRIIHAFNVHHELDHAEVQLGELGDVVDVFIIAESNRTTSGKPNKLQLLPKMKNEEFLSKYHSKIIHVTIPSTDFPKDPAEGGWKSDVFIRNYMGEKGLERIDGIQEDDLIVLTDADEFINKDVLMFLKLHDGYPEPIKINFRESENAYYWKRKYRGPTTGEIEHFSLQLNIASTIGMLRQVFGNQIMSMRRPFERPADFEERVADYIGDGKHKFDDNWVLGRTETSFAGYHCTWCFRPEGIREKWIACNKEEIANWGPNKERLDLEYIKVALKKGNLFGNPESALYKVKPLFDGDLNFAPAYVWKNKEKFGYLLYEDENLH